MRIQHESPEPWDGNPSVWDGDIPAYTSQAEPQPQRGLSRRKPVPPINERRFQDKEEEAAQDRQSFRIPPPSYTESDDASEFGEERPDESSGSWTPPESEAGCPSIPKQANGEKAWRIKGKDFTLSVLEAAILVKEGVLQFNALEA